MKIKLFTTFFLLICIEYMKSQGILNGSDAGQSQITFYENFSSATIANYSTATSLQWAYKNTAGSIVPTIGSVSGTAGWMASNEGYDLVSSKQALNIPFTASTDDIIIWTPVDTVPNSSRAWARFVLYFESNAFITGITLGVTFDLAPCDFSMGTAESSAGLSAYNLSYTTSTYGDGTSINNSTQGNYRIVYADLSRYAGHVGRVGVRVTAPTGSVLPEVVTIDNFAIGKRPSNDACSEAFGLINGNNGPFYNTLATGLLPRANTPVASNMGGMTLYLNPNSATTRPGDGFEPSSGGGVFSNTNSTVENSTWYKFTTPTLATMTACNGGLAPTSMQVKLTFNNLSCAAPSASVSADQQVRIFRSAFSCSSTNTATSEQQIAATTKANGGSITLSTADATALAYNSTYYMVVDGTIGNDCRFNILTETFLNGSLTPQTIPCTILPIELAYFDAKRVNGRVDLSWSTLSEKNNDYFTIERSVDAVNFETMSIIDGAGNSNIVNNYTIYDNSPVDGLNYYRLKQTDYDGQFTFSSIRSINFSSQVINCEYQLNQLNNKLVVRFNEKVNGVFNLNLVGLNGKSLLEESAIMENSDVVEIDLHNIVSGFYVLRVFSKECAFNKKIVIMK